MTTPILRAKEAERDIEAYLVRRVKGCGGEALKFTSPQRANVPDRIVLISKVDIKDDKGRHRDTIEARIVFVEVKAPGKEPTSGQLREHDRLLALGFAVYVVDTRPGVDAFIKAEFGK